MQARAEGRALLSAAFLGSSIGLGLGVTYLNAGLARDSADYAEAVRMADAAGRTYTGSYLEAEGRGLRLALNHYSFPARVESMVARRRYAEAMLIRRQADLDCMTQAVYYEARSESATGQAAVAQVVLNRVRHPAYPKTVCGVVFQGASHAGCQFSFTCDGSLNGRRETEAWNRARVVAARALSGRLASPIGRATHYHTTAVSPVWAPQMMRVAQVGAHVFYTASPYRVRLAAAQPVQRAILTRGPAPARELRVSASVEKAIEASLQPVSGEGAKPAPKPTEAAMLTLPPMSAGF